MSDPYAIPPKDRAAEGIKWYLLSEHLAPGDRLPAERVLCEQIGVSRTALRAAIAQLESAHVLESRVGSGTYVCPPKPLSIFQSAGSFSETVRAAGLVPTASVASAAVYEAPNEIAKKLTVAPGSPIFELSRVRLANNVPSALETAYVNLSACPGVEAHDYAKESLYEVLERDFGLVPEKSWERVSITQVNPQEATVLDVPEGSVAFFECGLELTKDDVPIEYFKSVIVPNRFRFASDSFEGEREGVARQWLLS